MTAILGKASKIYVSTNDSSYNEVIGLNSANLNHNYNQADVTRFGDLGKRQLSSTLEFSGSCSGFFDPSDTGIAAVRTASTAGSLLYVKFLHDGTNGYKCQCAIKNFKIDTKQGPDAVGFSFDFDNASGGAPTAVP